MESASSNRGAPTQRGWGVVVSASAESRQEPRRLAEPPDRSSVQVPHADGHDRAGGEEERAELRRYRALVEYAPDAVVILDLDAGRFVTVNAAAEELFGMGRAELLRAGPVQVSPPVQPDGRPSPAAAAAYLQRALAGERPRFEWVHCRADGVLVPCEVTLLRLPDPDRRLVRGSILDL